MVSCSCTRAHLERAASCRTSWKGTSVVAFKIQLALIWHPGDDRMSQLVPCLLCESVCFTGFLHNLQPHIHQWLTWYCNTVCLSDTLGNYGITLHITVLYYITVSYWWIYHISHSWLYSKGLDIRYLNIAQISGCKPICTVIMDSLVNPSSCCSGNATLAFLYNCMQINHANGSVWVLHCHCAVSVCSSPILVRADTLLLGQTH